MVLLCLCHGNGSVGALSMGGQAGLLREGACWGSTSPRFFRTPCLPFRVLCVPCHEHVGSGPIYIMGIRGCRANCEERNKPMAVRV